MQAKALKLSSTDNSKGVLHPNKSTTKLERRRRIEDLNEARRLQSELNTLLRFI